jgi:hypothetical protein
VGWGGAGNGAQERWCAERCSGAEAWKGVGFWSIVGVVVWFSAVLTREEQAMAIEFCVIPQGGKCGIGKRTAVHTSGEQG